MSKEREKTFEVYDKDNMLEFSVIQDLLESHIHQGWKIITPTLKGRVSVKPEDPKKGNVCYLSKDLDKEIAWEIAWENTLPLLFCLIWSKKEG